MKVTHNNLSKLEALTSDKPYKQPKRIPLAEIKKELKETGKDLTDERLQEIQNFIYQLSEIIYINWTKKNIQSKPIQDEESNIIYPSEYRRAS